MTFTELTVYIGSALMSLVGAFAFLEIYRKAKRLNTPTTTRHDNSAATLSFRASTDYATAASTRLTERIVDTRQEAFAEH